MKAFRLDETALREGTERSACQKSLFHKRVDGEASSHATATLSSFCLNPSYSGRKNCKETVFAVEN